MTEPLNLLAIGAHPDDVEMSCGGWLALAAMQGYRTGILHLTRGEMGTHGTPETREKEAREAARILGCKSVSFAGLRDGFLNDDHESVRALVEQLRALKPQVVVAPWFSCHHPDHEATARLAKKAVHFAALNGYKTELPPHRAQRLVHARYSRHFDESFFVDISEVIETKKAAILAYASQFRHVVEEDGKPVTRMSKAGFIDQFLSISAQFGLKAGCTHAEAYRVETAPVVGDPVKLFNEGPAQHLIR
ncbi:MAG: bacillithiol biosynthesis deacetylase BshB1 [Planctomycetes bacterium]|nr:bacillithiol biosynthesis deacetylase BshB1 [Planctomycetota bacterium]MCW8135104.1 bacillithiol biosynthesis deacetylase BshB1 [Planctomycetota bacterium]